MTPGQHQLKFIVDKEWKTSRNLPSATDNEGNLINYLLVRAPSQHGPMFPSWEDDETDDGLWGNEIPSPIASLGAHLDHYEQQHYNGQPATPSYRIQVLENLRPPLLPAPLRDVPLNKTLVVAQGSGDDNSILQKPDHSILDHLCASPISRGLLSVAATKRYRRKVRSSLTFAVDSADAVSQFVTIMCARKPFWLCRDIPLTLSCSYIRPMAPEATMTTA